MQVRFLGGAGTISGVKVLVEREGRRLLIDCGLFQGLKQLRLRNRTALPIPTASIDAVVLTHAHLGHSGFLPCLVELGFKGPVYATQGTADLCQLLLPEAGRMHEADAALANQQGYSKHAPALPLYTEESAHRALAQLEVRDFDQSFEATTGMFCRLHPAGHVLGAASVHLQCGDTSLLCSGDLGSGDDLVMRAPALPAAADLVMLESTYGQREHRMNETLSRLAKLITRTAQRGGVVVVLAHAAGQTQLLLRALEQLKHAQRIPQLPIHLNSPISAAASALYAQHVGAHRLSARDCEAMLADVQVAHTDEEAQALNQLDAPGIVVAAEGEAHGTRIAQHLKAYAGDARNAFVFAGQQGAGSRGAAMLAGAQQVKVQGDWLRLRAEVCALNGLAGHADRQGLIDWVLALPEAPKHLYLMHGEPEAADSLRQAIGERCDWPCSAAEAMELVNV